MMKTISWHASVPPAPSQGQNAAGSQDTAAAGDGGHGPQQARRLQVERRDQDHVATAGRTASAAPSGDRAASSADDAGVVGSSSVVVVGRVLVHQVSRFSVMQTVLTEQEPPATATAPAAAPAPDPAVHPRHGCAVAAGDDRRRRHHRRPNSGGGRTNRSSRHSRTTQHNHHTSSSGSGASTPEVPVITRTSRRWL